MSEHRYTLDEAGRELARRECVFHGHNWRVIERIAVGPTHIVCERCGETHRVETAHETAHDTPEHGL